MVSKHRKGIFLLILAALCALLALGLAMYTGRTYTIEYDLSDVNTELGYKGLYLDCHEGDPVIVRSIDIKDDKYVVTYEAGKPGISLVGLSSESKEFESGKFLVVNRLGIISFNSPIGDYTGDIALYVIFLFYLLVLLIFAVKGYIKSCRADIYTYRNVVYLGAVLFLTVLAAETFMQMFISNGFNSILSILQNSHFTVVMFSIPLVAVGSLLLMVFNAILLVKEGRSLKNLLGVFLGLALTSAIVIQYITPGLFMKLTFLDIGRETSPITHVEQFVEAFLANTYVYMLFISLATVVRASVAAKHIPSFDKDYIIILGCQIRRDGSLTALLRSRADRAIEFSVMQKEKSGKDITFIPSGGQGRDEVISEAEAIGRYLLEKGIPEDKILLETKSVNTEENIRFSNEIAKNDAGSEDYKLAFSTTNYHVLRAGDYAYRQDVKIEGIGAPTKAYFWINAFIREFIAGLVMEKKRHLKVISVIFLAQAAMSLICYLSALKVF